MAYNKKTREFERYNPKTEVGTGQYSDAQKKQMVRDAGYVGFNAGFENLTPSAFQDLFYRSGPKGEMAIKTDLADKYFKKGTSSDSEALGQSPWGGSVMADEYDKGAKAYVDSVRASEERTTQVGLDKFGRKKAELDLGMARNREDYEKYTGRQQVDYNRNLAASDKNIAKKLASAASGYGVRGLLSSGLFRQNQNEMVSDNEEDVATYKLNFERAKEDAATKNQRREQDYVTDVTNLETDKSNYQYGRKNEEYQAVAEATAATDAVWNAQVEAGNQTERRSASQAAYDKAYGTKTTPRKMPYRSGGKFTV